MIYLREKDPDSRKRGCRINFPKGEMRQPYCVSRNTVHLFLLYRGEKEAKRGTPKKSWVFRGLRTSGHGVAPTPGELRIPDHHFEKGGRKLSDCFATAPVFFTGTTGKNQADTDL